LKLETGIDRYVKAKDKLKDWDVSLFLAAGYVFNISGSLTLSFLVGFLFPVYSLIPFPIHCPLYPYLFL